MSRAEVAPEQQVSSPRSVVRKTLEPESTDGLDQFQSCESRGHAEKSADIIFYYPAARTEAACRWAAGRRGGSGRLVLLKVW